ncbi:aldo/keto reductase [Kribbella sp. NPDC004875]|uniref:aldo/keto reductase n=1 Tax=Kribbella sp. NPDC004875 TaxID=3364107 RepID=UPI00369D4CA4
MREIADRIAFGAMYLGTRLGERESFALLDRYVELGGRWIDTSNNYSFWEHPSGRGGQSEEVIGRWLAANPGVPVRLSTKVGAQPRFPGGFPDHLEGLARDVVRASLAESLTRLGRERVDLYWAHVEDDAVSPDDLIGTFGELVGEGTIGAYGVSNHPSWLIAELRTRAELAGRLGPSAWQMRYSYFQPLPGAPVEGQPLPLGMLSHDGVELLRRQPDLSGWIYTSLLLGAYEHDERLAAEYRHPGNVRRSAALDEVAKDRGLSRSQVVLAWLAGGRPALVPIVGASRPEQVEEAMAAVATDLTTDEQERLDTAS